jgi:hypothetical protein
VTDASGGQPVSMETCAVSELCDPDLPVGTEPPEPARG